MIDPYLYTIINYSIPARTTCALSVCIEKIREEYLILSGTLIYGWIWILFGIYLSLTSRSQPIEIALMIIANISLILSGATYIITQIYVYAYKKNEISVMAKILIITNAVIALPIVYKLIYWSYRIATELSQKHC